MRTDDREPPRARRDLEGAPHPPVRTVLTSRARVPAGWRQGPPTAPLVATRLAVGSREQMPGTLEGLAPLFEGHTVNGSRVMAGRGEAWSGYRMHTDGFGRIAVVVDDMSSQELGRTVERLLTIEDFYHLTLLPLQLAREAKVELAAAERRMLAEMDALRGASSVDQKRTCLLYTSPSPRD